MIKNQLEIDGIVVEILRKPIKNMHLRIYPPDGQVRVSAPLRLHLDLIRKQLEARRDWIHAQRTRLRNQITQQATMIETGERLYFLGQAYSLHIHETTKVMKVALEGEFIHCYVKAKASQIEKEKLIHDWYRQQMKVLIPTLLQKWETIIGVQVSGWGIKQMKTRWGSCNTRVGRIWLNLNLIKKPLVCLEYVLVHELVHLLEIHHNKRFYAFMDQFLPQWKDHQFLLEGRAPRA